MTELNKMAEELEKLYMEKEIELSNCSNSPEAYVWGELKNRKNDIEFFKACIPEITNDLTLKNEILKNFQKDMEKIKLGVEKIKCK